MKGLLTIFLFNLFFGTFAMPKYSKNIHIIISLIAICVYVVCLCIVSWAFLNFCVFVMLALVISMIYELKGYTRAVLMLAMIVLSYLSIIATLTDDPLPFFSLQLSYHLKPLLSNSILLLIILFIRICFKNYFFYETVRRPFALLLLPLSLIMMIQIMYFCLEQTALLNGSLVYSINICCYLYAILGITVYYYVEHICEESQKNIELNVAKGIIAKQSEQYAQLLKNNREIVKIRHDYNNFTIGLISEIENGNYDAALNELIKQKQIFNESAMLSNNVGIVHLIVEQKATIAKESNIVIDFTYHDLYKIEISDIDLAIILGNALDNAIDASRLLPPEQERKIYLSVKMRNNNIVVLIKNNVAENINVDDLSTTKKSKHLHGFGIESIRQLVEKYNGELVFNCQNQVFETHIMLSNIDD